MGSSPLCYRSCYTVSNIVANIPSLFFVMMRSCCTGSMSGDVAPTGLQ